MMKKLLSIILSAIMAVSMCTVAALPVLAADTVKSPTAAALQNDKATITVNGENRQGVTYGPSSTNSNEITFRYDGEGTLTGWENNLSALGLAVGTDYTLVQNPDGSLTITFISQAAIDQWNAGNVAINALVDFDEETTEEEIEEDEEEETTKKNISSKSPSTGASTTAIAGSVALAGAGIAIIAATKKRDAE
ncbi:MAG: hypothetical protein ACI4V4_01865 [Eubacterium sp.]